MLNRPKGSKCKGWTKTDFLMLYGVDMKTFQTWIEPIMEEIRWVKGEKQLFPPIVKEKIVALLGNPD